MLIISAASAVARTRSSSFQYHQQISYAKVMLLLYLSLGGACFSLYADWCIALKAYFANTNTDTPLAARMPEFVGYMLADAALVI